MNDVSEGGGGRGGTNKSRLRSSTSRHESIPGEYIEKRACINSDGCLERDEERKIGILIWLLRGEYEIRIRFIRGPSSVGEGNIRLRSRFAKFNLNLKFRGYYRPGAGIRSAFNHLFNV